MCACIYVCVCLSVYKITLSFYTHLLRVYWGDNSYKRRGVWDNCWKWGGAWGLLWDQPQLLLNGKQIPRTQQTQTPLREDHEDTSTFSKSNSVQFSSFQSLSRVRLFVTPSPLLALFIVMLSKAHLTSHSRMSGSR